MAKRKKGVAALGALFMLALILPDHAFAATTKTYTNNSGRFSFQYHTDWDVASSTSRPSYVTITPKSPKVLFTAIAEKYNSDAGMFSKEEKTALKKGFSAFTAQFVKDYKTSFGPTDALPNDSVSNVSSKSYTLRDGYRAWHISADRVTLDIPFHDEFYLITKDKKTVYLVWSMLFADKLPLPANPYAKDFTALVKSFFVTQTSSAAATQSVEDANLPFAALFPQQVLQLLRFQR